MRIGEAASGVGEEMADVGLAMQRAVDKTENMKARAGAVEELEAAGTFDDITQLGDGKDDIDRQLEQLTSTSQVDDELAKMKAELGAGPGGGAGELEARQDAGDRRRFVIVRIATDGQYVLDDAQTAKLNELDNAAVAAVDAGDEARFQSIFDEMLALVRAAARRSTATSSRRPT